MNIELTILKKEIEDLLDVREDCAERTEPRAFV
jgi:hypothetical protein